MKSSKDQEVAKKDKKTADQKYIEQILAPIIIAGYASYLYLNRETDERHNNLYHHPRSTLTQWTPIILTQALFLLTATTMLILRMNPGASNFHLSAAQRIIDKIEYAEPVVLAALSKVEIFVSRLAFGERATAINELIIKGSVIAEKLIRIAIIHNRLHEHKIARAIDTEDGKMTIRWTEAVVHRFDEIVTYSTEIAAETLYRMILMGLLSRYIPNINNENQLTALSAVYLAADAIEAGLMHLVSNAALATEIIIDNKVISRILKALKIAGNEGIEFQKEDPLVASIHNFIRVAAERIMQEGRKLKDDAEAAAEQIKSSAQAAARIMQEKSMQAKAEVETEIKLFEDEARAKMQQLEAAAKTESQRLIDEAKLIREEAATEITCLKEEAKIRIEQLLLDTKAESQKLMEEACLIRAQVETEIKQLKETAQGRIEQLEEEAHERIRQLEEAAQERVRWIEDATHKLSANILTDARQLEQDAVVEIHNLAQDAVGGAHQLTQDILDIGEHLVSAVSGGDLHQDQASQPKTEHDLLGDALIRFGQEISDGFNRHHSSALLNTSTSSSASTQPNASAAAKSAPKPKDSKVSENESSSDSKSGGAKQNALQEGVNFT